MKKTKVVLLSLLSLMMLAGCNGNTSSNAPSSSSTPTSSVSPISSLPASSVSPSSEVSSKPVSSDPVSSKEESSTPTSSSIDIYAGWDEEIKEAMELNLNYVLPFIDLGDQDMVEAKTATDYTTYETYFKITSDSWDASKLASFKATFEADGWTVVYDSDSETLTCTKESAHLKVVIFEGGLTDIWGDPIEDAEGYFELDCYYDEPFDPSTKTAWTQDELDNFNDAFHNHEIPYVYLGTKNPDIQISTYSGAFANIMGGKWDDSIVTSAETTFKLAGWDVVKETADKMNYYYVIGTEYITATKTFDDLCTLEVTIGANDSYSSSTTPLEIITYTEGYNPDGWSGWTEDQISEFNSNLDNHADKIPNLYIGTFNPTVKYNANGNYERITSYAYDVRILTDAKAKLEAFGYTVKVDTGKGTLTATLSLDDGCTLQITMSGYSSSWGASTVINISCFKWDPEGDTNTSWSDSVLESMEYTLGEDHNVPYFYIGSQEPTDNSDDSLDLVGDKWNDEVISLATTAFTNDSWTVTDTSTSNEKSLKAQKDFGDGYYVICTLGQNFYGNIEVEASVHETWDPSKYTDYDEDTKDNLETKFTSFSVPYIYLGCGTTTFNTGYYYDALVRGDLYNEELLTNAKSVLEKEGWECSEGSLTQYNSRIGLSAGNYIKATKTLDNHYLITIYVGNYGGLCAFTISVTEVYNPDLFTGWTDEQLETIKFVCNDNTIPNLYLGTTDPTIRDSGNTMTIYGSSTWNDQIVTDLKSALADWTFVTNTYESYYSTTVYDFWYKEVTGGTIKIKLVEGTATLTVTFIPSYSKDSGEGKWDTSLTSKLTTAFGEEVDIPYVYLGCKNDELTINDYLSYYNSVYIYGDVWSNDLGENFESTYTEAGWEVSKEYEQYQDTYTYTATKKMGNYNFTVKCFIEDDGIDAVMSISASKCFTPDDSTAWSTKVQTAIDNYIGEEGFLPFFYIGSEDDVVAGTDMWTGYFTVSGQSWDKDVLKEADKVLTEENGWSSKEEYDDWSGDWYGRMYTKPTSDGTQYVNVEVTQGIDGNIALYITLTNRYVPDYSTVTDWSDDIKGIADDYLGGHFMPYFDFGEYWYDDASVDDDGTTYFYLYTYFDWDDAIFTEIESKLDADNANKAEGDSDWVYSLEDGVLTFTKTFADGSTLEGSFEKPMFTGDDLCINFTYTPAGDSTNP